MTHYIRHIGIALLAVFMISLILPTAATAYHYHQLSHEKTSSVGWFSDCTKADKVFLSQKPQTQSKAKIVHHFPSEQETQPVVNTTCHAIAYLLQAEAVSLRKPLSQHLFRHEIVPLYSQLFESRIADPPQRIS